MRFPRFITTIFFLLALAGGTAALAQEHAAPAQPPAHGSPVPKGAEPHPQAGEEHAAEAEHAEGILPTIARLFNFAFLVGVLVYFLKSPIAAYMASRVTQIRQDLVAAAEMKASASAQRRDVEKRMAALPAELESLRRQGAEDVKAERERITRAAEQERVRLLDQTRREIDMRLRVAKRELTEHAAQLAVQVAERRIKRAITPDDQMRLVDRYASQLREAR